MSQMFKNFFSFPFLCIFVVYLFKIATQLSKIAGHVQEWVAKILKVGLNVKSGNNITEIIKSEKDKHIESVPYSKDNRFNYCYVTNNPCSCMKN